jgi:hypothetical protein
MALIRIHGILGAVFQEEIIPTKNQDKVSAERNSWAETMETPSFSLGLKLF